MTFTIELWHVVALAVSLVGAFWALVKVIVWQFDRNLDMRFKAQEQARSDASADWNKRFDRLDTGQRDLERRFNEHLASLPVEYQRREDAIRQEVAIIARLDGLAEMVGEKFDKTDQKIEALRRSQ